MKVLIAGTDKDTKNYQEALTRLGADFDVKLTEIDFDAYDRLILPGGGDIAPERFGQEDQGSRRIDRELDDKQFAAFEAFAKAGKPILGICRGEQIINVVLGGDLIQDLPTAADHARPAEDVDNTHEAVNEKGSLMERLFGERCIVNSAHHQGAGKIGRGLKVTMRAAADVVEAIEHESLPIIGVQWHPERTHMASDAKGKVADGSLLLQYFLNL